MQDQALAVYSSGTNGESDSCFKAHRRRVRRCCTGLLIAMASLLTFGAAAHATVSTPTVASDGAVDVNANWEKGSSAVWYIELQRFGTSYIEEGITLENDAEIRKGIAIINWGFAHESSDGSYAGTSDAFHSTAFFLEAAAHAALLLKNYSPVTYTANSAFYSSTVKTWTSDIALSDKWITTPSIASAAASTELPYTHRQWMLAACLAESASVTGNTSLLVNARAYATKGLSLQLGSGWLAAVPKAAAGGQYPPAVLVAPGAAIPSGAADVISAEGVNPEKSGYDVSYQGLGLMMADRYAKYCSDSAMAQQVDSVLERGLDWEEQWIAVDGTVTWDGSSRIGIELQRDGVVKGCDDGTIQDAFRVAGSLLGNNEYVDNANRIEQDGGGCLQYVVAANGAVSANGSYDAGTQSTYDIAQQNIGLKFVKIGISREDDQLIRTGMQIFQWGFAKESTQGTFTGASGSYWQPICFAEAAAEAALALKSYEPTTYTLDKTIYANFETACSSHIAEVAAWTTGTLSARIVAQLSTSSSHLYAYCALLAENKLLTPSAASPTSLTSSALSTALSLQSASGENAEKSGGDANDQAYGMEYAMSYYDLGVSTGDNAKIAQMLLLAAGWESQFIDSSGIVGQSSPATADISSAMLDAYLVSGKKLSLMDYNWLNSNIATELNAS